jgi:hypothetical protein
MLSGPCLKRRGDLSVAGTIGSPLYKVQGCFDIGIFLVSKGLHFLSMLLPLTVVDKFPEADLYPVHDRVSLLNFGQRFLFVSLNEYLNEGLNLLLLPLVLSLPILA